MSAFSENKWEASEIGDKLNTQLFKKNPKNVKNNKNKPEKLSKKKRKKPREEKIEAKDVKNALKRPHDSLIIKNCNNVKKIKLLKNSEGKINQSCSDMQLKEPKGDKRRNSKKIKNKKNIGTVGENNFNQDKTLKLKQKQRKNKLNHRNENPQIVGGKLNIKRIQELLSVKKSKNNKNVNQQPETLRERLMAQLRASRFRYLNETLYNNQSDESRKMFKEDPDAFKAYHTGYRQQVEQWPLNPLDIVISAIKKMPKDYIIADFGCGEARLADSVEQKVHSIDLIAVNEKVIASDMAHTPLLTNGIHVVVFCLSLMGSNLSDYIFEASRVLKMDGVLKIADIESRFENVDEFIVTLKSYGFKNTWKDLSHNLFYFMDFKKISDVDRKNKKLPPVSLKSCLYKKR